MYKYILYRSRGNGVKEIEDMLYAVRDRYNIPFEIIEIETLSEDEKRSLLESIREISRKNGFRVVSGGSGPLPISGSKKLSATGILLEFKNGRPYSVYPHEKNRKRIECTHRLNSLLQVDNISELKDEDSISEDDISRIITSFPRLIEDGLVFGDTEVEVNGGRIDAVFIDREGRHLLVEIELEAKDNAIGQVSRFKKPYSGKMSLPETMIRLAIVCAKIGRSRLEACKSADIEVYKICLEKLT